MNDDIAATAPPTIAVRGLDKAFDSRQVLKALDWSVPQGSVVGLLGRNGAGKSTLIRCLLGLSPFDAGTVDIFGKPVAALQGTDLHRIGYVPQTFDLFPWMRVRTYLRFMAAFYARWNHELVARLLETWDIAAKPRIGELSQGQRQKLAIIRALAPDPDLLVLDEPVASLDPQARRDFLGELMKVARRPGKTFVFSTHITADLERADASITLLKDGRMQFTRAMADLRSRVRRVVLERDTGFERAWREPGMLGSRLEDGTLHVLVDGWDDAAIAALAERHTARFRIEHPTLEDIFVEVG